jgi:HAD superfamily hydrolase (TIGR01509 family)
MIEAVVFDLYETLITETHAQPTRASSLGPALGLDPKTYRPEWKARRPRIVTGELSFRDALIEISTTLTGKADDNAVQRICEQRIREKTEACARPDNRVALLLAALGRAGIRLGVISNGFKEDVVPWPQCVLAPAFHATAFSCDEGVAKPSPEIYRRALERLGVEAKAAIFIGDGGDGELAGAEQTGLRVYRATWFVRNPTVTDAWPELANPQDVLHRLT